MSFKFCDQLLLKFLYLVLSPNLTFKSWMQTAKGGEDLNHDLHSSLPLPNENLY